MRQSLQRATGLAGVLRAVVADMQSASGADIVSIFLYEESTRRYYAPFATGQPQESLLDSLADMTEQLGRYADDASHGKVPDALGVHNYGSTVWLTVTRRPLVARDAPSQIDSTFIRRYQVQATIGLPIKSDDRLLGLIYLNYRERDKVPDDARVAELQRMAATAGEAVEAGPAPADRAPPDGPRRPAPPPPPPAGGALAHQRLIDGLERGNRLLGALGNMTAAMLRPGSGRKEVIESVVGHLTDASVPEFDFNFATVYLIDKQPDESMFVRLAAGAATIAAIEASVTGTGTHAARRVPRWALEEERPLAADDVLVYVARTWRTVIVGPLDLKGSNRSDVVSGPILGPASWVQLPVVRSHGGEIARVSACLLGDAELDHDRDTSKPPFTLAGEVFEKGGHADLIRIFVPFGSDQRSRASGVLEVGYHRSHERRPDWGQIEALRAAAGQVASAVETASLYEEARRHAEQLELGADR